MTRNILKVTLYTFLFAALILTVSCGQRPADTPEATMPIGSAEKAVKAPDKEPYLIGAVFAVTGDAAWLGEPEKNTAEMVVEKINAAGGVNGHPIKLIIEDTEGENQKSLQAVNKLISQDVLAIIGPSRSGCTMAVVPTMNAEEVPLISCAAAAAIVEPIAERKWIFKTPQRDDDCARRIFEHAKANGYTDIAIITGTTGFGSEGRKQLKKLAPEYGINIVADETYNPGDTEMTAQLTKIKNTSAKALVNWSIVPAQSTVPKNMKQLDMDIQLYQSHGFGNIKYVESAGEAAEGIIFPAGRLLAVDSVPDSNIQKKVLKEYSTEYKEKFGEAPSTFGGHAYDGVMIVAKALEAADPDLSDVKAARAALRDEIEKVKGYVGTAGVFNMSAEDHCGLAPEAFAILTVKNGEFTILED